MEPTFTAGMGEPTLAPLTIMTLVTFSAVQIVSTLSLNEGGYVFLDSAAGNVVAQTGSRSVQLGTH
jgi:hypothetical protein